MTRAEFGLWLLRKFNRNHDARGRFSSGSGVSTADAGPIRMLTKTGDAWQEWGYSHASSKAIAHEAAKIAGIDGYEGLVHHNGEEFQPRQAVTNLARRTLEDIREGGVSDTEFYHGFEDHEHVDWQPGQ